MMNRWGIPRNMTARLLLYNVQDRTVQRMVIHTYLQEFP